VPKILILPLNFSKIEVTSHFEANIFRQKMFVNFPTAKKLGWAIVPLPHLCRDTTVKNVVYLFPCDASFVQQAFGERKKRQRIHLKN